MAGFFSLRNLPQPLIVPPVPRPATKASKRPLGLLPELRAGEAVVRLDVVGVVVLVQVEAVGRLGGQPLGHRVVAVGRVGRDVGGGDHHLRAEGLERVLLLLRHLVRHGEDAAVALHRRGHGHRHPGVAAGVLDDGAARPQQPGPLGLLEDVERHPVLDGAGRVHELELGEDGGVARAAPPCAGGPAGCGRSRRGRSRGRPWGAGSGTGGDGLIGTPDQVARRQGGRSGGRQRGGAHARPTDRSARPRGRRPGHRRRRSAAPVRRLAGHASMRSYWRVGTPPDSRVVMVMPPDARPEEVTKGGPPPVNPFVNVQRYLGGAGRAGAGHPRLRRGRGAHGPRGPGRRDAGDAAPGRRAARSRSTSEAIDQLARLRAAAERTARGLRRLHPRLRPRPLPLGAPALPWSGGSRPGRAPGSPPAEQARVDGATSTRIAEDPRRRAHGVHPPRLPVAQPHGAARAGEQAVIDFQDALLGPAPVRPGGAPARQLRGARRRPSSRPCSAATWLGAGRRPVGPGSTTAAFRATFDLLTVQRKLKDAGRFVFIDRVRKNPGFLRSIPARSATCARPWPPPGPGRAAGGAGPPRAGAGVSERGAKGVDFASAAGAPPCGSPSSRTSTPTSRRSSPSWRTPGSRAPTRSPSWATWSATAPTPWRCWSG